MPELMQEVHGNMVIKERAQQIVSSGALAPSLLLVGTAGVGKKQFAIALVQSFLCDEKLVTGNSACGRCSSCHRVANLQHESLLLVEPEKQLIKIEQARQAIEFFSLRALSKRRFVVINRAECLNPQAANAMLKIIEEPPAFSHFILVTAHPSRLLSTIRSRCQTWRFSDPEQDRLALSLSTPEGAELRGLALHLLAGFAQGTVLSKLSELSDVTKNKDTFSLFLQFLLQLLRDVSLSSVNAEAIIHLDKKKNIVDLAKFWSLDDIQEIFNLIVELESAPRRNLDLSLALESFVYKVSAIKSGAFQ